MPKAAQMVWMLCFLRKQKHDGIQTLVFVPTIHMANTLYRFLRLTHRCAVFTSKTKEKEKVIDEFHEKRYDFLITTTILERGITIRGIYVMTYVQIIPFFKRPVSSK